MKKKPRPAGGRDYVLERIGIPLPPGCQAHYRRMLRRRTVRRVLQEEGYRSAL